MSRREEAERLAGERQDMRAARNFARADALREEIGALGFDVVDTPAGPELKERPRFERFDPNAVPEEPMTIDATIHLLYEGHRSDLLRFLEGVAACTGEFEILITDNASEEGDWIQSCATGRTRALHFDRATGWAQARNAAARASHGRILVFADLSVEPRGDILGPLLAALEVPSVGICGPWGLVSDDLREFRESPGPAVDAIEGYLLAMRREVFERSRFDPWFRWYRHADLDLSFRVRDGGLHARVVPVPAERREHRGWSEVPEPERSARSKRNFYRFLDRWKDRSDLLTRSNDAALGEV